MRSNSRFVEILESSLEELVELSYSGEITDPLERLYSEALMYYLKGEEALLKEYSEGSLGALKPLVEFRYKLLTNTYRKEDVDRLFNHLSQVLPFSIEGLWRGELLFVVANAYLESGCFEKAKENFKSAFRVLKMHGAERKAVRALFNAVVAESRIHPSKSLICDYEIVIKQASRVGDRATQGMCELNISREYDLLGSSRTAMEHIQKSIAYLSDDKQTRHYFLALTHRSHLYLQLGQFERAYLDYEAASISPHEQVQESLKVLNRLIGHKQEIEESRISVMWKEKLHSKRSFEKFKGLTDSEIRVIDLLKESPLKKEDLIERLYGDQIDYQSALNRFKVLLSRLRKKNPNLIEMDKSKYRLSDRYFEHSIDRILQG